MLAYRLDVFAACVGTATKRKKNKTKKKESNSVIKANIRSKFELNRVK